MNKRSVPYIRFDAVEDLPTGFDELRAQLRLSPTDLSTKNDELYFYQKKSDGSAAWRKISVETDAVNLIIQEDDVTVGGGVPSVIDFEGDDFDVTAPTSEFNIALAAPICATIGPLYVNDIPGTATTAMVPGYLDTTSSIIAGGSAEIHMASAGWIVGMILNCRNSRTAGTAIAKARIGGTTTDFAGNACFLNGTNTLRISAFTTLSNGLAFTAGQRIGIDLVTSGWTPITTDATAWLVVQIKP